MSGVVVSKKHTLIYSGFKAPELVQALLPCSRGDFQMHVPPQHPQNTSNCAAEESNFELFELFGSSSLLDLQWCLDF